MILVPLVFFSIVNGISNLASSNKAGTIWRSTLLYFAGTMFFAVFIAMLAMNFFKPGVGVSIDTWQLNEVATSEALSFKDFIYQFILGLFICKLNFLYTKYICLFYFRNLSYCSQKENPG